jgi:hypothetical protein
MSIEVVQMDQWSASELRRGSGPMPQFDDQPHILVRNEGDQPRKGMVWFVKDQATGEMKVWKSNYDSSD